MIYEVSLSSLFYLSTPVHATHSLVTSTLSPANSVLCSCSLAKTPTASLSLTVTSLHHRPWLLWMDERSLARYESLYNVVVVAVLVVLVVVVVVVV